MVPHPQGASTARAKLIKAWYNINIRTLLALVIQPSGTERLGSSTPTTGATMKTFIVGFNKHNGKMGKRTIKARNREEAIAKCAHRVDNSFWHFIKDVK